MSTKEHLLKAREHIMAKQYQEARDILYQIDHPTARKWLAKLDEIDPPDIPEDPFAPMTLDPVPEPPSFKQTIPEPQPMTPTPEPIEPMVTGNYLKQKDKKGSTIPMPLAIAILAGVFALCVCSTVGIWVISQATETFGSVLADSEPELDLSSDFGTAIQYGDSVSGRLSDSFPLENWRFAANEGDRIVITMRSAEFDSLLELYDTHGTFLTEDDDSGGDLDAQIVYTIPQSGDYIITATEWWSEIGIVGGDYSLTLERR